MQEEHLRLIEPACFILQSGAHLRVSLSRLGRDAGPLMMRCRKRDPYDQESLRPVRLLRTRPPGWVAVERDLSARSLKTHGGKSMR